MVGAINKYINSLGAVALMSYYLSMELVVGYLVQSLYFLSFDLGYLDVVLRAGLFGMCCLSLWRYDSFNTHSYLGLRAWQGCSCHLANIVR